VQRALWAIAVVLGCYVALVAVSLVGTPGLSRLSVPGLGSVLPGPRAPQLTTTTGTRRAPGRVLPPAVSPSPSHAASAAPVRSPSPAPTPARQPTPTPAASPVPTRSPSPSGPPRATPSAAASPTAVPSTSTRPTQRSSRAPSAHPSRQPR